MTTQTVPQQTAPSTKKPPFYIDRNEERELRMRAERLQPSLVVDQAASFDEYVRQLMIPPTVMDLARKAANLRLASWEVQAIRSLLAPGWGAAAPLLRSILVRKAEEDDTHPPYIRVACTGKGLYDDWAEPYGFDETKQANFGSPAVLEIWPAQHYSPMHSHGDTTGIIHCLAGQLDVMCYEKLDWNATKRGLVTLTPGQCAWLSKKQYAVHKVFCPLDGGEQPTALLNDTGDFGASFHVYLNETETTGEEPVPAVLSRDSFSYIDERTHELKEFTTYSDLSWPALRAAMTHVASAG
ncbi:hypothetical protein CDG81_02440 [Actinopolyspora erythraea]|uniref:Cysteine dioxygenase n=1 Tax=Actinopolyspora erythraea TaxID=414996 RepID=A0A099D2I0_9ACTN|nr:hypothetical protein [Actinopolyspora erythraea]ASU77358.1 hypothetical protein CDG81_02440 [Actinopolyspora erythraea]KGI80146.1 hypothetical protein IL38_18535 [Actinopolyspora erythraea]